MAYAPHLTEGQIERIREYAKPRQVVTDEILYEPGFDTPPVYVVISGAIRIVAVGGETERTVTTYRPTQFSGELLMISGRRSIYRCQAVEAGTLLELCAKDLRTLIGKDAELSDIIMNAFLARRLSLKETPARQCSSSWLEIFHKHTCDTRVPNPRWAPVQLFRSRLRSGNAGLARSLRRY